MPCAFAFNAYYVNAFGGRLYVEYVRIEMFSCAANERFGLVELDFRPGDDGGGSQNVAQTAVPDSSVCAVLVFRVRFHPVRRGFLSGLAGFSLWRARSRLFDFAACCLAKFS